MKQKLLICKVAPISGTPIWGDSINGGTPKSSIFSWIFHYKPSMWGYPHGHGNPHLFHRLKIGTLSIAMCTCAASHVGVVPPATDAEKN